jgi:hypothetical protein
MMDVICECPFCGKTYDVKVPVDGYLAWANGKTIQEAMPNISAEVRESLISGLCSSCQKEFFIEDEAIYV